MKKYINPVIKPEIFVPDYREKYYRMMENAFGHLHVPMPQLFIETQIWDGRGNCIHHKQQRGHSWVRNAYNIALCTFASKDADDATTHGGGYLNVKDTGGTVRNTNSIPIMNDSHVSSADDAGGGYLAIADDDTYGILVGDDNTAVSFEDYVLLSKIASGEGAGELSYTAMQTHDESYVAGTKTFTISHARYFNNNESGEGAVSVEEAALVVEAYAAADTRLLLVSRDLTGSLSVPYTGQLKVTYAISLVYTA